MLSGLYLITDRKACGDRPVAEFAQAAVDGGLKLLQYREKELSRRESYETATTLRELTRSFGVTLIINDDVDLALAVGADGVHLGQEDLPLSVARRILGPDKIIGISARDIQAARRAVEEGADYIAVGPIFRSKTKQVRPPLGCDIIREIHKAVHLPIFGIGGIDFNNACEVIRAGADGVAVIAALHEVKDVTRATREFLALLDSCLPSAKKS